MFVLAFKNVNGDLTRDSFIEYYMPLVETKDFTALTYNRTFFDQRVNNEQEPYKKLVEMSKNNDYI